MSDRVASLPIESRVEVYRRRAGRMLRLARQCENPSIRLAYLKLAAHWQDLIVDLEQARTIRPDQIEPNRPSATKDA